MTSTAYDFYISQQLEPDLVIRVGRRYERVPIEYPHDPVREAEYRRRLNAEWQQEVEERDLSNNLKQ